MIGLDSRKRVLASAAVTAAAAGATYLALMFAGPLLFLPVMPFAAAFPYASPTMSTIVLLGVYVVVPLGAVVFWRRPWWARWACLGCLLNSFGLLLYLAVHWNFSIFSP